MRVEKSTIQTVAKLAGTVVQTITIRQRGDSWFATSEDEPTIFCAASSRLELMVMLAHALTR